MRTRSARQRAVTMRDIAAEVGVSVATVSYAINGRDELVAEGTRDRILATARRLDYQPNQLMKAVRTRRSEVIGVMIPSFRTTFFPEIADAIECALAECGYHAVMCQTHSLRDVAAQDLTMLRQRRVDGIIATPHASMASIFHTALAAGLKTVFIDAHIPALPIPSVQSDDHLGSYLATRHLIDQGHERIATVRYPDHQLTGGMRARFEGYREALIEAGLPTNEELVAIDDPLDSAGTAELACDLLRRTGATAIFVPIDMLALRLLKMARETDRSVPGDLAVVGYCNQDAGRHTTPTLTTVDQNPGRIGQVAAERLLAMIEGAPDPYPQHSLVEPKLVVRESSVIPSKPKGPAA